MLNQKYAKDIEGILLEKKISDFFNPNCHNGCNFSDVLREPN